MTEDSTEMTVHGLIMRAARALAEDKIPATRSDAQEMVRRFEATNCPVLSRYDHARYTKVLITAAAGDRFVSDQFEVLTDHLTSLVLPGLDVLSLVDNETGERILPGDTLHTFSVGKGQDTGPADFLGIRATRTGRIMVEVEDAEGPVTLFQYRLSAHVVGKDGKQVHTVRTGR